MKTIKDWKETMQFYFLNTVPLRTHPSHILVPRLFHCYATVVLPEEPPAFIYHHGPPFFCSNHSLSPNFHPRNSCFTTTNNNLITRHQKQSSFYSFPYYLQFAEKHAIHTNGGLLQNLCFIFCLGD